MPAAGPVRGPPPSLQEPEPAAWIAKERTGPRGSVGPFAAFAVPLAIAAFVTLLVLAGRVGDALPGETAATEDGGWYADVAEGLATSTLRIVSAVAGAGLVLATAYVGRRLTHDNLVAGLAPLVLVLDPAFLLTGHLATPEILLALAGMAAAAFALSPFPALHWAVPVPLALGGVIDATFLLWSLPIFALLWLRGHIYSAPKHLGRALLQALIIPGVITSAAALAAATQDVGEVRCLPGDPARLLWLGDLSQYGPGAVAVHSPFIWFAGVGAIAILAAAALWHVASRFRMTRLPGRIQWRLGAPMPRAHGRSLWLGLLFIAAPGGVVWGPLGAIGLAMGAVVLGRDARAFGIGTAAAAVLFATIHLVRFAPFVVGDATAADLDGLQQMISWSRLSSC